METKISGSSRRALCSNTSPIHFLFSICGTPLVDIHYICVPLSQNRVEMSHACRFCSHLDFMPFAKACCNWHSPQRCLVFVLSIKQRSLTVRISTRNSYAIIRGCVRLSVTHLSFTEIVFPDTQNHTQTLPL